MIIILYAFTYSEHFVASHTVYPDYDSLLKQLKLCFNDMFKYNDKTLDNKYNMIVLWHPNNKFDF